MRRWLVTDPRDAHSAAVERPAQPGQIRVQADDDLVVMGMLADRRRQLSAAQ